MRFVSAFLYVFIFAFTVNFCSCSIEKRQHRDGYHVQLFKKNSERKNERKEEKKSIAEMATKQATADAFDTDNRVAAVEKSTSKQEIQVQSLNQPEKLGGHAKSISGIGNRTRFSQIRKELKDDMISAIASEEEEAESESSGKEHKNYLGGIGGIFIALGFFSYLFGIIFTGQAATETIGLALATIAPGFLVGLGMMMVAGSILIMLGKKQSKRTKKNTWINMISGYVVALIFAIMVSGMDFFSSFVFPAGWPILVEASIIIALMAIAGAALLNLVALLMSIGKEKK